MPLKLQLIDDISFAKIDQLIKEIENSIDEDPRKPIHLKIISYGGSAGAGIGFYDFIKDQKINLSTFGYGVIDSTALPVWLAAKPEQRKIGKHSTFNVHELAKTFDEKTHFHTSDLERETNELAALQKSFFSIVAKETKKSLHEIEEIARKSKRFSVAEAIEFGLIRKEEVT